MDTSSLVEYVVGRLRSNVAKAELKEELSALGWTEEEVERAYRDAVVALGAPVPSEGNRVFASRKAGAVDVVINFFSFILLGIVATALGTLYFQVINLLLPDPLDATGWYSESHSMSSIHYSIAALLIGFPMYYFALRLWFRKFREDEGRTESKLSKWLTYLVLLVTAVTIVGDLIAIVFTVLQGEITTRFFLKALVLLVIAGAIFGFYYLERRKIQYHVDITQQTFQYFGRVVTVFVLIGIALGFSMGGTPTKQRDRTFDQTRAENLNMLATCIEQYAGNLGALPKSLDDLRQSSQFNYCASYFKDPETSQSYRYRVVTPSRIEGVVSVGEFELCATFVLPSDETTSMGATYGVSNTVWYEHSAGESCDTVKAILATPSTGNTPAMMIK